MKKIGLLAMALVLALGGLGIGYAAWTDTITIDGTVNTGDVDIEVLDYSSTCVCKTDPLYDLDGDDIEVVRGWHDIGNQQPAPAGHLFCVAWTTATSGGDDVVTVTFNNLFPSIDFVSDFLVHYNGSIPVKLNVSDITITNDDSTGPDLSPYVSLRYYWSDIDKTKGAEIVDILGTQLHQSNYIIVEVVIHLAQLDELQNQSGTITGTIGVIQWNEYTP